MSDNEEQSLQALLRSVALRRPSAQLDTRVRNSLARRRFLPLRIAMAAAILFGLLGVVLKFVTPGPRPTPSPVVAVSVSDLTTRLTCDTVGTTDDSVIVADNTPYTVTRQTTMHDEVLIDPKTHARLEVQTPVDRVVISKAEVF